MRKEWDRRHRYVMRRRIAGGYEAGRMQAREEGGERPLGQVAAMAKCLLGQAQARGHACRPGQQAGNESP